MGVTWDLHGLTWEVLRKREGEELRCEKMLKSEEMGKMCGKLGIKKDLQELK